MNTNLRLTVRRIDGHFRVVASDPEWLETDDASAAFGDRIQQVCDGFRRFLADASVAGKSVAAYGAAAKGNTFLNVARIGADMIAFVVDRNPEKQNQLLPGSHIPVLAPDALREHRPDYVVILPWNLADEISAEHAYVSNWGGRFVRAIPELTLL